MERPSIPPDKKVKGGDPRIPEARLLKSLGMSNSEIGRRLGVAATVVYNWVTDRTAYYAAQHARRQAQDEEYRRRKREAVTAANARRAAANNVQRGDKKKTPGAGATEV